MTYIRHKLGIERDRRVRDPPSHWARLRHFIRCCVLVQAGMTGNCPDMTVKNCWLLCKELAQTNSNQSNHSCFCIVWFFCVCVTSQSKIKLCRDGPTYVDHVLSKDRGHNASLDPQLLGLKSSTLPPSHCVPLLFEENAMQFYYPSYQWLCHTGLLVISFAACFFFFFFCFFSFSFLQQLMLTLPLPRAVAVS